jgi:hypothetical protein
VIRTTTLALHRVLVVTDVLAVTVPADAARSCSLFRRIEEWLLALVVRTVRLDQVDDVEFVAHVLACVADFEVEPLDVRGGAVVVLKDQVVGVVAHEHYSPKISRFEAAFKNQSVVAVRIFDVVRL